MASIASGGAATRSREHEAVCGTVARGKTKSAKAIPGFPIAEPRATSGDAKEDARIPSIQSREAGTAPRERSSLEKHERGTAGKSPRTNAGEAAQVNVRILAAPAALIALIEIVLASVGPQARPSDASTAASPRPRQH